MSRDEYAIIDTDLSRRRHRFLMQQVMRRVESYQSLWMTSETAGESSYLKGRYLAAKDFYEWLAEGGTIAASQEYLDAMMVKSRAKANEWEGFRFNDSLNRQVMRIRKDKARKAELMAKSPLTEAEATELRTLRFETEGHWYMTEEQIIKGYKHVFTPGFSITKEEDESMRRLAVEMGAWEVEASHLERLLKIPFVAGTADEPPAPPVRRAVVEENDEDD